MPTQTELDKCYMQVCESHAELSKAKRAKVGACLVTENGVTIAGVNGLPKALGNDLEYEEEWHPERDADKFGDIGWTRLVTKPETLHAETAILLKAAREGIRLQGGVLYLTLSPCAHCSSMLIAAGIREVIYKEAYRDTKGLDNLKRSGILIRQFTPNI